MGMGDGLTPLIFDIEQSGKLTQDRGCLVKRCLHEAACGRGMAGWMGGVMEGRTETGSGSQSTLPLPAYISSRRAGMRGGHRKPITKTH